MVAGYGDHGRGVRNSGGTGDVPTSPHESTSLERIEGRITDATTRSWRGLLAGQHDETEPVFACGRRMAQLGVSHPLVTQLPDAEVSHRRVIVV